MFSLLQISGRGWYEGGGGGGNRILRRDVCWLRAQPGIYHCLVRKQSVFLQLSFKLLQISNFSLPSAGQIWKDLQYSQGQVKPSKQKQLWQTFREREKDELVPCLYISLCLLSDSLTVDLAQWMGVTKPLLLCSPHYQCDYHCNCPALSVISPANAPQLHCPSPQQTVPCPPLPQNTTWGPTLPR